MERIFVVVLLMVLMVSGLAIIYSKYSTRLIFSQIQMAEHKLEQLEVSWKRLIIEERMLSEHNQVEKTARKKMGLVEPDRQAIIYIQL
jgi:cell division protein FtsL